jgi:shikimate kinase
MTTPRAGLALIGPRGTGKTTVGRILAARLGRTFLDTDDLIQELDGRTIARIFAEEGEPRFRDYESAALECVLGHPGAVVATGGGIVLREPNRRALRQFGFVAWLTAGSETLADRLRADPEGLLGRPALTVAGTLGEITAVMAAREPLYREVADVGIDTSALTVAEVADAVLAAWAP